MELKELREKSSKDLNQELLDLNREYFQLRMSKGTGHFVQTHLFKKIRRNIARVKTVLREGL